MALNRSESDWKGLRERSSLISLPLPFMMDSGGNVSGMEWIPTEPIVIIDHNANRPLIIVAYSLIVLVSLAGNALVCKVAFSGRRLPGRTQRARTSTDLLIGSLAFSDLVMTIFNIPFNVARILLPYWPFGEYLCYGVPFVQTACVYVSTFTMTAIAAHRWRMVTTHGHHCGHSTRKVILGVWLLSCLLALPTVWFNTLKEINVNGEMVIRCRVHYPTSLGFNVSLFLTVEIFLTQYLIPLVVTGVLYLRIARVVNQQGRLVTIPADDDRRRKRQLELKRRRIAMLALVVIVFAICWLPLNLYHLIIDLRLGQHWLTVFLVCHWFAMSSVCYNSLIYCWLNESFRNDAWELLECRVFHCIVNAHKKTRQGGPGGSANGAPEANGGLGGTSRGDALARSRIIITKASDPKHNEYVYDPDDEEDDEDDVQRPNSGLALTSRTNRLSINTLQTTITSTSGSTAHNPSRLAPVVSLDERSMISCTRTDDLGGEEFDNMI